MSKHTTLFICSTLLFIVLTSSTTTLYHQVERTKHITPFARTLTITLKENSEFEIGSYKPHADSAVKIAEAVFNSSEFQERIGSLNFKHSSYCRQRTSCKKNEKDSGIEIKGQEVLADIFKEPSVQLSLYVEDNGKALGSACPNQYAITMYYNNIMEDMKTDQIPPSYKLAVNLCHEYMHHLGYCHIYGNLNEENNLPDSRYLNRDVTYTVGWEAYYILKSWRSQGKKIPNL